MVGLRSTTYPPRGDNFDNGLTPTPQTARLNVRLLQKHERQEHDRALENVTVGSASAVIDEDAQVLACAGFDHTVRWRDGERLEQLFESRCDWMRANGQSDQVAVDAGATKLTYQQLDEQANQLARYLLAQGAKGGYRIGLIFDHAPYSYVGMLAVLKINAVYVPLDIGFPVDRLDYIVRDANVRMVLSLSHLRQRIGDLPAPIVCVDETAARIAAEDDSRLTYAEKGDPVDDTCYIIYTSGSTGRPKGVAVEHPSICNFVRVAGEVYGVGPQDRVYQGMTIAFDFSVEEIWVPWMVGATLVPKPNGANLVGYELQEYLKTHGVTALCCVPTLLATLDEDLPDLKFLLVSGEACPQDLIARWHRPWRRFLNVYGPTEATVTATWTTVHPNKPVTIGVPLPTYSVVILDPDQERALSLGDTGEIGIAGIGLARGYLNRDDLTERAFIRDFVGIENNPSGRIYRTGDLGRVNDNGQIEYHGRIDTQVKIRGYRIELTEIESVLLQVPEIAQAVVDTWRPEPDTVELVGYYSLREGVASVDRDYVYQLLRDRLPGYMVPAYLEQLDIIPMTTSNKADRKNLPTPTQPRTLACNEYVEPTSDAERGLAEVLAEVLRVERVSVDSNFFEDLGANSLLLARFCAQARKRTDLPSASMRDVYLNPTIRALAAALPEASKGPVAPAVPVQPAAKVATWRYMLCGALQLLVFLGYVYLYARLLDDGFDWVFASTNLVDAYLRSVEFGAVCFAALCLLSVAAKWLLIGRWKAQEFDIWSLTYVRFWIVKMLIRSSPLRLFIGSPFYVLYLRSLGATVGRDVAIFSQNMPICTDLLTIGSGTVIRKDSYLNGYRAQAGRIQIGPVTLGEGVFVGEATVLDINTSLGNQAQLGHTSSLHAGQSVPDGEHWHGSPAQPTTVDYRTVDPTKCGPLRKIMYSIAQILNMLLLYVPLALVVTNELYSILITDQASSSGWSLYGDEMVASLVLDVGAILFALVLVFTLGRLLNLLLVPGKVYPLYGLRDTIMRTTRRLTNSRVLTYLFGDSSYIVYYLLMLGYNLGRVEQTGSNFGVEVKHDTPFMSSIGSGTMVSDGLSLVSTDLSSTSFRVRPTTIGPRNFLGNNIVYPVGGRTGDNCLLATKVMIPLDGPIRENTGLLGSPCFEIPRSVQRDATFDHLKTGDQLRRGLAAKNRHNAVTIGLYLLSLWVNLFGLTVINVAATQLYARFGSMTTEVGLVCSVLFMVVWWILVERAVQGFRALRPRFCSIYDRTFWRHERYWKMSGGRYLALFNGTPFKNTVWRLLGIHIGHRVFDDGCAIPEKTLVTIGDGCTLNSGSVIQAHSLEDGTFKSDHIVISANSTIGASAFVHYGVTIGDNSVLDPDSFLMKGTEVASGARWRGNPATELANPPTNGSIV